MFFCVIIAKISTFSSLGHKTWRVAFLRGRKWCVSVALQLIIWIVCLFPKLCSGFGSANRLMRGVCTLKQQSTALGTECSPPWTNTWSCSATAFQVREAGAGRREMIYTSVTKRHVRGQKNEHVEWEWMNQADTSEWRRQSRTCRFLLRSQTPVRSVGQLRLVVWNEDERFP